MKSEPEKNLLTEEEIQVIQESNTQAYVDARKRLLDDPATDDEWEKTVAGTSSEED